MVFLCEVDMGEASAFNKRDRKAPRPSYTHSKQIGSRFVMKIKALNFIYGVVLEKIIELKYLEGLHFPKFHVTLPQW